MLKSGSVSLLTRTFAFCAATELLPMEDLVVYSPLKITCFRSRLLMYIYIYIFRKQGGALGGGSVYASVSEKEISKRKADGGFSKEGTPASTLGARGRPNVDLEWILGRPWAYRKIIEISCPAKKHKKHAVSAPWPPQGSILMVF